MEILGTGAAQLNILFQIGSYRTIIFDFGIDISTWTFEFFVKKNKGARLKDISLTLNNGLSFPIYQSNQLQATFSIANTSIEEGEYYYELRRTDISLPLINGLAYFFYDAPSGTIDDTVLELTVSSQIVDIAISNINTDGLIKYKGVWNAASGTLPSSNVSQANIYYINPGGNIPFGAGSVDITSGTMAMALIDNPGQTITNWKFF